MTDCPRHVCPKCLMLRSGGEGRCSDCGQPLSWIDMVPALRDALTPSRNPGWRPELQLRARWDDEQTTVIRSGPGAFELIAGSQTVFHCGLDDAFGQLQITWDGSSQVLNLPGETRIGDFDLQARVQATLAGRTKAMAISEFRSGAIVVDDGDAKFLGRLNECHVQLAADGVAAKHCLLVTERASIGGAAARHWIVDLGSVQGTFVNRQRVLCRALEGDDLVQIGPFAWTFHASGGLLVPVASVQGVAVRLCDIGVDHRLSAINLHVPRGQFLAIVGRSGSGKSTLLKAIVGVPGFRERGQVLIDERDTSLDETGFRSLLGYVSQDSVIHPDLRNREVLRLGARLRGQAVTPQRIEAVLQQVDLPPERWAAFPDELSGGQRKRLQTAAELVSEPYLLLLDEPTSGLDPERECSLLRLLRNLSYRGCTVVVVTHSVSRLEQFDRVLRIDAGRVLFDGPPSQLAGKIPGTLDGLDATDLSEHTNATSFQPSSIRSIAHVLTSFRKRRGSVRATKVQHGIGNFVRHLADGRRQFFLLFGRECIRFANRWPRRLAPLCGVPVLFAAALHLAVPGTKTEQLGFLTLLSVIWLGASQSLLAIADEREIVDHERLLFLRVAPYLAAKTIFLWLLSMFQTAWLFATLMGLRAWTGRSGDMLYGQWRPLVFLLPVACAAIGLGLVISAVVGRNRQWATAILPLIMMVQILFSAQVRHGDSNLEEAYQDLHFHRCQGQVRETIPAPRISPEDAISEMGRRHPLPASVRCRLSAERLEWFPTDQRWRWLCLRCAVRLVTQSSQPEKPGNGPEPENQDSAELLALPVIETSAEERELAKQCDSRPSMFAIAATYLTVSRYADIMLRSFCYTNSDYARYRGANDRGSCGDQYSRWRFEAMVVLILSAIGLPILAGAILEVQASAVFRRTVSLMRERLRPLAS